MPLVILHSFSFSIAHSSRILLACGQCWCFCVCSLLLCQRWNSFVLSGVCSLLRVLGLPLTQCEKAALGVSKQLLTGMSLLSRFFTTTSSCVQRKGRETSYLCPARYSRFRIFRHGKNVRLWVSSFFLPSHSTQGFGNGNCVGFGQRRYAFCLWNHISWGNRGTNCQETSTAGIPNRCNISMNGLKGFTKWTPQERNWLSQSIKSDCRCISSIELSSSLVSHGCIYDSVDKICTTAGPDSEFDLS